MATLQTLSRHLTPEEREIAEMPSDQITPKNFSKYIDVFTKLIKDETSANIVYKRFEDSVSDVLNVRRFYSALCGHAQDLVTCEIDRLTLSPDESRNFESLLQLTAEMFHHSSHCRREIAEHRNSDFINAAFHSVLSTDPATTKAGYLDALSGLTHDEDFRMKIWACLDGSNILTEEMVDAQKGGIIDDINVIESENKSFPLLGAFIRLLSYLVEDSPPPVNFERYNRFCLEQGLLKLNSRQFARKEERYEILCYLCQLWTNLARHKNLDPHPVFQMALSDFRFVQELANLVASEAPDDALFCVFRLWAQLCHGELNFMKEKNAVSVSQQISHFSKALMKIIAAIGSKDKDLQVIAVTLARILTSRVPLTVQNVFSTPDAKAIPVLKQVFMRHESEDSICVRVLVLELLASLGSSSPFLRYVCGFDTSALQMSTPENGIIPVLLDELYKTEAAKNYPNFAAATLKIFILLCSNPRTSEQAIDFLRSSASSFFGEQLRFLADPSSSLTAVGCYLQILAREAVDSTQRIASGTTLDAFRILMSPGNLVARRNVMVDEFIDRINNSQEGTVVSRGLFELLSAYSMSSAIKEEVEVYLDLWLQLFNHFLCHLVKVIGEIQNESTALYIGDTIAVTARFLVDRKGLKCSPELAKSIFVALQRLKHRARLGLYILMESLDDISHINENSFVSAVTEDITGAVPAVRAAALQATEKLMPLISEKPMDLVIRKAIESLETDRRDLEHDFEKGCFLFNSKFSLILRYLIKYPAKAKVFVETDFLPKIFDLPLWETIDESVFTSTMLYLSDVKLGTASRSLEVLSALHHSLPQSTTLNEGIMSFLTKWESQFLAVLDYEGLRTEAALKFLFDLTVFLLKTEPPANFKEPLSKLKRSSIVRSQWRTLFRERKVLRNQRSSPEVVQRAERIMARLNNILSNASLD